MLNVNAQRKALADERDRQHALAELALAKRDSVGFRQHAEEFHRLAGQVGYP